MRLLGRRLAIGIAPSRSPKYEPDGQRPARPYRVLATAIFLPGFGHVVGGFPQRGLILQLFMILMAWITWHATPPERDIVGRLAGGIFIYALSIMDACRLAQLRYAAYGRSSGASRPTGGREARS